MPEAEPMRIGVVSDTHGFFDPQLEELLRGVELILHAGDVGKQEVLNGLGRIAPVRAVQGNMDPPQLNLPPSQIATLGGLQVEIAHQLPATQTDLEKWASQAPAGGAAVRRQEVFLRSFEQHTRVVVFGHSHSPCAVTLGGKLFFNPGSAGKQRFFLPRCCGLLDVSATKVEATILGLERYNGKLPEKVSLAVGG